MTLNAKEKTLVELKNNNETIKELEEQIETLNRNKDIPGGIAEYEKKIEGSAVFYQRHSLAELVREREQEILALGSQLEDPRIKEIEEQTKKLNEEFASNETQLLEQIRSLEMSISDLKDSNASL